MPKYSLIIPVYNRPEELRELLESINHQIFRDFEVIVVDDGSVISSREIVEIYDSKIKIQYFQKENSGPGLSRNFGADKASGTILIFLDSDCLLPQEYLAQVDLFVSTQNIDAFGGPDRAHKSFSSIQKAINYAMTSYLTTGGIRGRKKQLEKYKPRSFNMGINRKAFEQIGGFNKMRFGEDIDLSIRLERQGYRSVLIDKAYLYHKRRSNLKQFFIQVYNSGMARIHLSLMHPGSMKLVHVLPSLFIIACFSTAFLSFIHIIFLAPLTTFILMLFIHSSWSNKSLVVGFLSIIVSFIQLFGYGMGFISSLFQTKILGQKPHFGFEKTFYK